jgi:hypothetical protein
MSSGETFESQGSPPASDLTSGFQPVEVYY